MRFLDLFSGIGGFSLGLERAGHETKAFCEIDAFCRRVLKKHWPNVPRYEDIRELTADRLRADRIEVDAICGGFPCQDISVAGKGAGIEGERSGLWSEYARIIGEVRPRYVIVENVAALLGRGLDRILGDLAALGFDAEWHCIPASAVGAPHRRDRVWIVAHTALVQSGRQEQRTKWERIGECGQSINVANANWAGLQGQREQQIEQRPPQFFCGGLPRNSGWWLTEPNVGGSPDGFPVWLHRFVGWGMTYGESIRSVEALRQLWSADVAQTIWQAIGGFDRFFQAQVLFAIVRQYEKNPDQARLFLASAEALETIVRSLRRTQATSRPSRRSRQNEQPPDEHPDALQVVPQLPPRDGETPWNSNSWEDGIPRVANGVPARVDRLRSLGNAVVPQIPEIIGRALRGGK